MRKRTLRSNLRLLLHISPGIRSQKEGTKELLDLKAHSLINSFLTSIKYFLNSLLTTTLNPQVW